MKPFLKWAGGKRWLFTDNFIASLPKFDRYIEPFLGGGAGFFALEPDRALLSDANYELIETYKTVASNPRELLALLAEHQRNHSRTHYYTVRSNVPEGHLMRAARFIYLNRTCWNGLYRVNRRGEFNVPIGTKTTVLFPDDDFEHLSKILQGAILRNQDFEETLAEAGPGDLVYVDPPYTVKHNNNGFIKYNEKIFSWDDQVRLVKSCRAAADRGAKLVISNADHDSLRTIYEESGTTTSVPRVSVLAGKSSARQKISEILVRMN